MKQYLFLLTIGPVQSFIQQARKTQDLYAGSKLLSYLLFSGAKKLVELNNNNSNIIITPQIDSQYFKGKQFDLSIPNVLVAKIELSDKGNASEMGKDVELAVRTAFRQNGDDAINGIAKPPSFDPQIEAHLNIHWLFVELVTDYSSAYSNLMNTLAGLKSIRHFGQYRYQDKGALYGERGRKCNVDGERNVVVYRRTKDETEKSKNLNSKLYLDTNEFIELEWDDRITLFKIWDIAEGEGLSAVSFARRRFLNKPHELPSTTRIALLHLRDRIKDWPEFRELEKGIEGGKKDTWLRHSNDELYYEENINRKVFFKEGDFRTEKEAETAVNNARSIHKKVTDRMKADGVKEKFCKYYAMVASDGDEMGKWLSGERLSEEQKSGMEQYHRDLTTALGNYANKNSEIESRFGQSVYTGGEDYLGFFNLYHVITQLEEMHGRYSNYINEPVTRWRNGEPMTLSAGVAIAHYKEPLSRVVKQSHALERKSKNDGRNRFSIGLMKRSGSDIICTYEWEMNGVKVLEQMRMIIDELQAHFSDNWIKAFFDLNDLLGNDTHWNDYLKKEMKRLIGRSNKMKRGEDDDEVSFNQEKEAVNTKLLDAITRIWDDDSIENFRNMLIICEFIARQTHNIEQ
jgi:CRISPR-associated protein Cmr2